MKRCHFFIPAFCAIIFGLPIGNAADNNAPIVPPQKGKSETIALFDRKSLDGWEGHPNRWSVSNGEIIGKNSDQVKVSTYLLTKQKFSDFQLIFSAKLVESEMHTGIAIWGAAAPDRGDKYAYKGPLVMFPKPWGMYDVLGRAGLNVDAAPALKVGSQHDWNHMELFAQGNRVRLVLNGVLVVDWREPDPTRIKEARIALQLHWNTEPQEVRFKGLKLITFPNDQRLDGKKIGDKVAPPK